MISLQTSLAVLQMLASVTYEAAPVKAVVHVHLGEPLTVADTVRITITTFAPLLSEAEQLETGKKRLYRAAPPMQELISIPSLKLRSSRRTMEGEIAPGNLVLDAWVFDFHPKLPGDAEIPAMTIPFWPSREGQTPKTITTDPIPFSVSSVLPKEFPEGVEIKPAVTELPQIRRFTLSWWVLIALIVVVWGRLRKDYWAEKLFGRKVSEEGRRKRTNADVAIADLEIVTRPIDVQRIFRSFVQDEWGFDAAVLSAEELRNHSDVPNLLREPLAKLAGQIEKAVYDRGHEPVSSDLLMDLQQFFRKGSSPRLTNS